jgi:hypothetical protein
MHPSMETQAGSLRIDSQCHMEQSVPGMLKWHHGQAHGRALRGSRGWFLLELDADIHLKG